MSVIDVLNSAFAADSNAMHALMCNRVPCNDALAFHPRVQVKGAIAMGEGAAEELYFQVGTLGVINAILDELGHNRVASKWGDPDEDGQRQFLGFCEYIIDQDKG